MRLIAACAYVLPTVLATALALPAAAMLSGQAMAGDADFSADVVNPTPEYLAARKELEDMLSVSPTLRDQKRDFDLYEIICEPQSLHRVVITNNLAERTVYHALVVRVVNQTIDTADRLAVSYKAYAQVLKAAADQYAAAKVQSEGGSVQLVVNGPDGQPLKDGLVVERQDNRARARTVRLSAELATENVSRLVSLANITDRAQQLAWERDVAAKRAAKAGGESAPAPAKRADPHFADPGEADAAVLVDDVRRQMEQKLNRRLLTPAELAAFPLEPFDGVKRMHTADIADAKFAMNGWYVGEAYVVFVFPSVSELARSLTFTIHGLSNKMRHDATLPEPVAGQKDDYYARHYLRRSYQIAYTRAGDEYYRDRDEMTLRTHGWKWLPAFVRIQVKGEIAQANYVIENIRQPTSLEQPDEKIAAENWQRYDAFRAEADEGAMTIQELRQALPANLKPPAAAAP